MIARPENLAPNKCIKTSSTAFHSFEATDADLHAHNLTNWQQEYDQLSAGKFYGQITELNIQGVQVFKEHTSQALRQSCIIPNGCLWLGLSTNHQKAARINGTNVLAEDVMCKLSGQTFELITPETFDIFGLVINQNLIAHSAAIQGLDINLERDARAGQLSLSTDLIQSVRFLMGHLLNNQHITASQHLNHDLVMILVLEILQKNSGINKQTVTFKRRKKVVDIAKEYVIENCHKPMSILQLCEVANVSRRTLQYSFENVLGISPTKFLRITRLNGVRRALSQQHSGTISEVAGQWGFWHLSQFSQDYKILFDELPSETFRRKY